MSISTVKALISARLAGGTAGSVTAESLRDALEQLCDAIISDRIAANVEYSSPAAPLAASDVEAALDEVAGILNLKATLASPTFTGTPAAPTATTPTSSTQIATTAFVHAVVDAVIDSSPGALDTLNELAAALGDDANFAATMTTALAGKLSLAGGTMTGDIVLDGDPTIALHPATKQYVDALGALSPWARKTAAYTASTGDRLLADTVATAAFTITLPASPSDGNEVTIAPSSAYETNNLTIGRNGETIMGDAADLTVDVTTAVTLVYDGTDSDWRIF